MRFAGNFHPEWGYLAPAPSFLRTARVALVAAAVGATAGAGVVLSLTDRPVETSVAARTLVRPVEAAASDVDRASQAALVQAAAQPVVQPQAAKPVPASAGAPIASESTSVTTAAAPANIAALAEAPFAAPVNGRGGGAQEGQDQAMPHAIQRATARSPSCRANTPSAARLDGPTAMRGGAATPRKALATAEPASSRSRSASLEARSAPARGSACGDK